MKQKPWESERSEKNICNVTQLVGGCVMNKRSCGTTRKWEK